MSKKLVSVLTLLVAVTLFIAACGGGGGSSGGQSGGGGGSNAATFNTTASDTFKFDPNAFTVRAGQQVTVNLKNSGTLKHTFVLKEANVKIQAEGGQTQSATFTAPAAGTYKFICDEPGHEPAGMSGTLTVQ